MPARGCQRGGWWLGGLLGYTRLLHGSIAPFRKADHPVPVLVSLLKFVFYHRRKRNLLERCSNREHGTSHHNDKTMLRQRHECCMAMRVINWGQLKAMRCLFVCVVRTPLACPTSIFLARSVNSVASMCPLLSTSYNPNAMSIFASRSPGSTAKQAWQYSWDLIVGESFQAQKASK